MVKYDPKMEFSVGLLTDQLTYYSNSFRGSNVPHFTGDNTCSQNTAGLSSRQEAKNESNARDFPKTGSGQ
jgi:hypothetical protein